MPTYDEEVLADNPVGYWKIEDLSTLGDLIDSSGNDYHGTFFTTSPVPVLGQIGPIETDADNHGGSSRIATIEIGAGHDLDVSDNFTWEVWGYLNDTVQNYVQLCRQGSFALNGSNLIGFDSGHAKARVSVGNGGANTFNVATASALSSGAWYHMVLVRNGTTILLYVNGILADQDTGFPAGTISFPAYNDEGWTIGASLPSGTSDYSEGTSRVAIYNTALSAGRVLAHYEAAKASLPLRATIVINLGLELNTDQIVPVNFPFGHNYSEPFGDAQVAIVEELSYATNVNRSEPDYEQRVSARPHGALRTLEYHLTPSGAAARSRLHGSLYAPAQFYCLPVWSDSGVLTGTATSGTNTLDLDTTKRDYEVGSYVGICSDIQDPTSFQFFKITSVADAQLTLESNIGTTVASGSPVFPARVVSISEDTLAVKSFAADHEGSVIRFDVIESELSTRRITTYTPATTYKSIEVFTIESAKYSFLNSRPYDIERRFQARGRDYQYAMDSGSPQSFPVEFLLTSRAALSEFYGWLDARCGKLNPVWVSSKERDLTITARPTATTLTVSPKTGFTFHHARRDIEFLLTDGSFSRKRVTGITDNGTTETWEFDAALPSFASIAKASFLKYCTLGQDIIQIHHRKGGIAECSINLRELLTSPA